MARAVYGVSVDSSFERGKTLQRLRRFEERGYILRHDGGWKGGSMTTLGKNVALFAQMFPAQHKERLPHRQILAPLALARTLYPSRVVADVGNQWPLKPGSNNSKIGLKVTKGRLKGYNIYSLTLEERATCPRSCEVWRECYGNNMGMATRYAYTPELLLRIEAQIEKLIGPTSRRRLRGVLLRLHVLGDFPSQNYVGFWTRMLGRYDRLSIFGYTAHLRDSAVGYHIGLLNEAYTARESVSRFNVRFSTSLDGIADRTASWRAVGAGVPPGTFACLEQTGQAPSCAECAACWEGTKPVSFEMH